MAGAKRTQCLYTHVHCISSFPECLPERDLKFMGWHPIRAGRPAVGSSNTGVLLSPFKNKKLKGSYLFSPFSGIIRAPSQIRHRDPK